MALFLVFVLPICATGALTRALVDLGQNPSSGNSNEEHEEREEPEELEAVKRTSRLPPDAPAITIETRSPRPAFTPPARVTSVAAKPHPFRYSERRLR
jgi:hypothetical protein